MPPGSLLLETAALRRIWARSSEGTFTYRWTHPDPRMDALQAEVARTWRPAAEARPTRPSRSTACARSPTAAAGAPAPARVAAGTAPGRKRPPRLTEAWFC